MIDDTGHHLPLPRTGRHQNPGEFSTECKVGSFGPARQGDRVSVRASEKDGLRKLGRALQGFGLDLICDWYEATRFTPTVVPFLP